MIRVFYTKINVDNRKKIKQREVQVRTTIVTTSILINVLIFIFMIVNWI